MQAIREVGAMAKAGEWEQVEALATALTNTKLLLRRLAEKDAAQYVERLSAAARLVPERKLKGDAAAAQLAELYSSLPTLWRVEIGPRRHRLQPLLRLGRRAGAGKSQQAPLRRMADF
jgi:hypothetical protein